MLHDTIRCWTRNRNEESSTRLLQLCELGLSRNKKKIVSGTDLVNDPLTFCGLLIDGLSNSDGEGSMLVVLIKFILSG